MAKSRLLTPLFIQLFGLILTALVLDFGYTLRVFVQSSIFFWGLLCVLEIFMVGIRNDSPRGNGVPLVLDLYTRYGLLLLFLVFYVWLSK